MLYGFKIRSYADGTFWVVFEVNTSLTQLLYHFSFEHKLPSITHKESKALYSILQSWLIEHFQSHNKDFTAFLD